VRFWAYSFSWDFFTTPLNLIDFVAILPFYVDLIVLAAGVSGDGALKLLRLFRLVRVMRVFKLSKYNSNLIVCMNAMIESQDTLALMAFMLGIVVIVFSAFIFFFEEGELITYTNADNTTLEGYYVEDCICTADAQALQANPLACWSPTKFESIPASAWWTIVTMMTVGYGDIFPLTITGKIVATVAMICSIVILALPISVIGANFSNAWLERKDTDDRYMDGHEVSIVYRNVINNIAEHNSILEDILTEGTTRMLHLQKLLQQAQQEYQVMWRAAQKGRVIDPRAEDLPMALEPSPKLARLLAEIQQEEATIDEAMNRTQLVQNEEFNIEVKQAVSFGLEMERVLAEQFMVSAIIEERETGAMGRCLSVPFVAGNQPERLAGSPSPSE